MSKVHEITSSLENLHLDYRPKPIPSYSLPDSCSLQLNKPKPRRLVSLCLGLLGQCLEDIITDVVDISAGFPPDIKLALVAIARRRKLLNDAFIIGLAEKSWELLDISGSDVTDSGLSKVVKLCKNLHAVDISQCNKITATGVKELIWHCRSLKILRWGGSPRSDLTAQRCLSILKPKLNDVEEDSWEELDNIDIGSGAQSLRWLIWPKIDEDSKLCLATDCPRIIVNPQPLPLGYRGKQVPIEALATVPLDHSIVKDIDPKIWAFSGAPQKMHSIAPSATNNSPEQPELPIAEKFRLAFLERDARLAPKRAKNARQQKRRAEKEYLMSSTDAKSIALASKALKSLHNRS